MALCFNYFILILTNLQKVLSKIHFKLFNCLAIQLYGISIILTYSYLTARHFLERSNLTYLCLLDKLKKNANKMTMLEIIADRR